MPTVLTSTKETPLKTRRSSPNLLGSTWSSPTLSRPTAVSRPSSDETYGLPSLASDHVVVKNIILRNYCALRSRLSEAVANTQIGLSLSTR